METIQNNRVVSLFDRFCLVLPQGLKCYADGLDGKRVVFITSWSKRFNVSFEEGMQMMDMIPEIQGETSIHYEYRQDGKYIHLCRSSKGKIPYAFFHIALEDSEGITYFLPGQMVVHGTYTWSDGIEPVLMELLDGISLI